MMTNPNQLIDQITAHYQDVMSRYEDAQSAAAVYSEVLALISKLEEVKERAKSCILADLAISGQDRGRLEGVASYGLSQIDSFDKNAWELAKIADPNLAQLEQAAQAATEQLKQAQANYHKTMGRFFFNRPRGEQQDG